MGRGDRLGWSVLALQMAAGRLAARNLASLPELPEVLSACERFGHVSIVVPARDEAASLPHLLASLNALDYVDRDLVVVDDASSDGTGAVAAAAGARVVRLAGPPDGWTGKSFACHAGAADSRGDWILFTDADTIHGPHSLSLALAAAVRLEAGLLSLLPRQRCETFWEKLLLPYAYALYFVGAGSANQPHGPAIANGQYLLFRREAYERIGGHEAVRGSVIEDVDLARRARDHGVRVALLRTDRQVEVRMYSGLSGIWEGFGKNAVRFLQASPRGGILTALASISFAASVPAAIGTRSRLLRLALLAAPAGALLPWLRRFGTDSWFALLHPLAAAVFQSLALDSIRRTVVHGATWKGRRY